MRVAGRLLPTTLALLVVLAAVPGHAQDAETCPHQERWQPSPEKLRATLQAHQEWLDNGGQWDPAIPGRAILCYADLEGTPLQDADLRGAQLQDADLRGAQLQDADLRGAQLQGADLEGTPLQDADLSGAQLQDANLWRAQLQDANLIGAQLQGAYLWRAPLQDASLSGAQLQGANLIGAQLQGAYLIGARLYRANLEDADLSGADLRAANLSLATLRATNLEGAKLSGAVLFDAVYEAATAPARGHLTDLRGLTTVHFRPGQGSGLVQLRAQLAEAGLRDLERQATYALERQSTRHKLQAWREQPLSSLGVGLEGAFRRVAFEWPVGYGLYPGRALRVLLASIGIFAVIYLFPLYTAGSTIHRRYRAQPEREECPEQIIGDVQAIRRTEVRRPHLRGLGGPKLRRFRRFVRFKWLRIVAAFYKGSIWRIWPNERLEAAVRNAKWHEQGKAEPLRPRGVRATLGRALQFSLLSAFHLGFREINVGSWIARVQAQEYTLRATGWVRVVAGIQSLLSIYLIAIWALTYFGRPFQ